MQSIDCVGHAVHAPLRYIGGARAVVAVPPTPLAAIMRELGISQRALARPELRVSQRALARRLDQPLRSVQNWLRGTRPTPPDVLERARELLDEAWAAEDAAAPLSPSSAPPPPAPPAPPPTAHPPSAPDPPDASSTAAAPEVSLDVQLEEAYERLAIVEADAEDDPSLGPALREAWARVHRLRAAFDAA